MQSEFESKLKETIGIGYDDEVERKISEFGGLLSRNAAVRLLCRQHGIATERKITLHEAEKEKLPFSFEAKIDRIFPLQVYANGMEKSARLHLSDSGGTATLVLWGSQTSLLEGAISSGDTVFCSGAYFGNGEIHLSRNGRMEKLSGAVPAKLIGLAEGICNVEGNVGKTEPDYHYIDRKTGAEKKLSSFQLCQGEDCVRAVVWQPENVAMPSAGDDVRLESVVFKNGELHFNASSRLVRLSGSSNELSGKLEKVEVANGNVSFAIGSEKFALSLEEALRLLGIRQVPEGVNAETLVLIKVEGMDGKEVRYGKKDGKLVLIRQMEEKK